MNDSHREPLYVNTIIASTYCTSLHTNRHNSHKILATKKLIPSLNI